MPKIASFHKFSLASWTAVMLRMDVQRVVARESISSRTGAWRVGPWRLASRGARDCLLILPACALSWVRNEFLWMLAVLFVAILFSNRLLTWGSFHFFQNSKVHQQNQSSTGLLQQIDFLKKCNFQGVSTEEHECHSRVQVQKYYYSHASHKSEVN